MPQFTDHRHNYVVFYLYCGAILGLKKRILQLRHCASVGKEVRSCKTSALLWGNNYPAWCLIVPYKCSMAWNNSTSTFCFHRLLTGIRCVYTWYFSTSLLWLPWVYWMRHFPDTNHQLLFEAITAGRTPLFRIYDCRGPRQLLSLSYRLCRAASILL